MRNGTKSPFRYPRPEARAVRMANCRRVSGVTSFSSSMTSSNSAVSRGAIRARTSSESTTCHMSRSNSSSSREESPPHHVTMRVIAIASASKASRSPSTRRSYAPASASLLTRALSAILIRTVSGLSCRSEVLEDEDSSANCAKSLSIRMRRESLLLPQPDTAFETSPIAISSPNRSRTVARSSSEDA